MNKALQNRAALVAALRGEVVGPACSEDCTAVEFREDSFIDPNGQVRAPLCWSDANGDLQEILFFDRESPHRKYGIGLLHPRMNSGQDQMPCVVDDGDRLGADISPDLLDEVVDDNNSEREADPLGEPVTAEDLDNEINLSESDSRMPSTMGISFFAKFEKQGALRLCLPLRRSFSWQSQNQDPCLLNGVYRQCERQWIHPETGEKKSGDAWRRIPLAAKDIEVFVSGHELRDREQISKKLDGIFDPRLELVWSLYPRRYNDGWLITVVLQNKSNAEFGTDARQLTLYQSLFEVTPVDAWFLPYPESLVARDSDDDEELSLKLLYRDSVTWGIGHNCAAGWEVGAHEEAPTSLFADVYPTTELPSMTPDVEINGQPLQITMRELYELDDGGESQGWRSLEALLTGYRLWIKEQRRLAESLDADFKIVATSNIDACEKAVHRMTRGFERLQTSTDCREAFRSANLSMLLQQVATKQINKRALVWDEVTKRIHPAGNFLDPWEIVHSMSEDSPRVGCWRAFQIGFFLLSIEGIYDPSSEDRDIVDLIWFPTGGGKTEAYLGVVSFYLFFQRLVGSRHANLAVDGTAVLMRYTLRMLTVQQFQRAASLLCAMEYLRRNAIDLGLNPIGGNRFSLGLWVGGDGAPNNNADAATKVERYRKDKISGSPLVLTECPWCRSEIGKYRGDRPKSLPEKQWSNMTLRGISRGPDKAPLMHCPDPKCEFGQEDSADWLPIEVIDERIYKNPPSFIISTADKLAMVAYRPEAGAIFGISHPRTGQPIRTACPPGLIIQDELHLISGPLGTMYALYEGVLEALCTYEAGESTVRPKLVASTATIRGASNQVKSLYARDMTALFPPPALTMGDSFFGRYARDDDGTLLPGRLYVGVMGVNYGSILTSQVRAFSSLLHRVWGFDSDERDPWWSLLVFYNSIRELSGARTLFDSDIRSRLKFLFSRQGAPKQTRRNLMSVEELTGRGSQADIVKLMDQLSTPYAGGSTTDVVDACLASNIIEVGVDIDRLSLMAVVGQPKSTASYIQVTGRVGRRWSDRPGLVVTMYSPSKSRDQSHYEQFYSYHRRLYEMVEPTSATPFALSAIERGLAGALLFYSRQKASGSVTSTSEYETAILEAVDLLERRCKQIQAPADVARSLKEIASSKTDLLDKWKKNPQLWEEFPPRIDGDYLMLWPGQFYTSLQHHKGVVVPTSLRQVDQSGELEVSAAYDLNLDDN